jgi:hypothetical protein
MLALLSSGFVALAVASKSKSKKLRCYKKAMLRMPFLLRFCIRGAH